jgi:HPt (histidine-containing phosphotransfer) domain-containing protein
MAALAHKLKGSAGLYGYSELASCVEGLERLAKLKVGDPTQSLEGIKHTVEKIVAGRTITAQRGQAPAAGGHVTPST